MKTQQIKFHVQGEQSNHGGILVDDKYIICGCCGSVFEMDDEEVIVIEKYNYWVALDDEIIGE